MDLARKRFAEVAAFVKAVGLLSPGRTLKLELGSSAAMRAKHGTDSFADNTLGLTRSVLLRQGHRETRQVEGISVVRGLPWPIFDGVVAHELGHVWAAENNLLLGTVEEEGLCEVIAYHWYTRHGTLGAERLAAAIETSPSPVYGDGFRMMRKVQSGRNLEQFISAMLSRTQR
ncbi:MAG: protein DA1 [Phaeospirillum sp.]|nr:protein DA1 [Phaeospirillum sp.]